MAKVQFFVDEMTCHFNQLEAPRLVINPLHPSPSVLVISIMAVLGGATGQTAIPD